MKPSVLTQPDHLASQANHQENTIECKFLFTRQLYRACHISVPDATHRLPAITCDGQYYSFFKVIPDPAKLLAVIVRLSKREQRVAVTSTKRGYGLWVYEAQGVYAPPSQKPNHALKAVIGPATCHILLDAQGIETCQFCSFSVPEMEKPLQGLQYRGELYSIYKQDTLPEMVILIAGKLAQRGDITVLTRTPEGQYVLAVKEPAGYGVSF